MNRTPYKLKLWASFEKENRFITLFLDMNSVTGFYIPEKDRSSDDSSKTINLLFGAEVMTVMQEPHLIKFLKETFIDEGIIK